MNNKEDDSILTQFERHIKVIYSNTNLPETQYTEIKRAFYDGFATLYFSHTPDNEEKFFKQMKAYEHELRSFLEIEARVNRH